MDELPFSNIAREFVGDDHGGVGICAIVVDAPPGHGPSLHKHPYDEVLITQEGNVTFFLGDEQREVGPGRSSSSPPGSGTVSSTRATGRCARSTSTSARGSRRSGSRPASPTA